MPPRAAEHTHRWTVALRSAASPADHPHTFGGADDYSYLIKKVQFKLHETIPNSLRTLDKPPWQVTETGWGEFELSVKVWFVNDANEKPLTFFHFLKLHPWPRELVAPSNRIKAEEDEPEEGEAGEEGHVYSWHYDDLVFTEPSEALFRLLTQHPPTPLPKEPRWHVVGPTGPGGNRLEFSEAVKEKEGERLEQARKEVMQETEAWRNRLLRAEEKKKARDAQEPEGGAES